MPTARVVAFCFVLVVSNSVAAQSIPEPTDLYVAASAPGSDVVSIADVARVDSSEAVALVSIVEIVGPGDQRKQGIRFTLDSGGDIDQVYLDRSEAMQLREELGDLDRGFEEPESCSGLCMHGIARCRPSQSVPQAYCPVVYLTGEGEKGLFFDTPRQRFRYPSTRPSAFADAVGSAIGELAIEVL